MVRIYEALKIAEERIKKTTSNTPLLDAEVLLCDILHVERWFLHTHKDKELNDEEEKKYFLSINKRIKGCPVQYITNKQEFMALDFHVEEGVLIPRPDTEILVESVIHWVNDNKMCSDKINILDLGTGSGAISISLAKYIKKSFIYSVDISSKALDIANKNAVLNGVDHQITFLKGDLFEPIIDLKRNFDIIVSNPPYIPTKEIDKLQIEVSQYEPRLALDGGLEGLDFYRKITQKASYFLKEGGLIALEVGHDQGNIVKEMLEEKGCYHNIQRIKDLAGIERVVVATTYTNVIK